MDNPIAQSENFRQQGHLIIDYIADYLAKCSLSGIPVTTPLDPELSVAYWKDIFYNKSIKAESIFTEIIERSTHLHHPGYVGHQVAAGHPIGILADMVAATLDNGMAVYEMGQVSVALEKIVCTILTDLLKWGEKATGFFTSGGTLANLTALLTARQIYSDYEYWDQGANDKKYAVMVSAEAHYCIDRAVKIMGLGKNGIVSVPTTQDFKIDVLQLESTYQNAKERGLEIFAFVANAGSTGTGSYDDLNAISEFCKSKKIWMHVDGAHGGAVLISNKYQHLIDGIEHADSMTLDFHKLLQTPILSTALLYKNEANSYETFSQGAKYLYQDQSHEWYQLGKRTFECTKPMMVVKAFCILKEIGIVRLGSDIDYRYDLAKEFAEILENDPMFELACLPESNIVCFRLILPDRTTTEINELTKNIRLEVNKSGSFYIVQTQIQDKVFFRCSLMNVATTIEVLQNLLNKIKSFIIN